MRFPIVPEAAEAVPPALGVAAVLFFYGTFLWRPWLWGAAAAAVLLSGLLLNFFRDPERDPGRELMPGEVLCPADGVVVACHEAEEPLYLKGPSFHVAVFMNVFDCHVQRAPLGGKVLKKAYHPGRFFAASDNKASLENEQAHLLVELPEKKRRRMVIKQIAGLLARRVVTDVEPGVTLERGGRIGRILLGSRVDVFLPKGFRPLVGLGSRVKAGRTILGVLS